MAHDIFKFLEMQLPVLYAIISLNPRNLLEL